MIGIIGFTLFHGLTKASLCFNPFLAHLSELCCTPGDAATAADDFAIRVARTGG